MKDHLVWEENAYGWTLRFANATGGLAYLNVGNRAWYVQSPTLGKGTVTLFATELDAAKEETRALVAGWLREVATMLEERI